MNTALMCLYIKTHHIRNHQYKIYDDNIIPLLLSENEYKSISDSLINGIDYFDPSFKNKKEEALKYIVDNILSPTILARTTYTKNMFNLDKKLGLKQYLMFASGYDTIGYSDKKIKIYELDRSKIIKDKIKRLKNAQFNYDHIEYINANLANNKWINSLIKKNYDINNKTFCSLLGISYYLNKEDFKKLINNISSILCEGSTIVFDYQTYEETTNQNKIEKLAKQLNEEMKSKYSKNELESILEDSNMLIYENLNNKDIDNNYFYNYNTLNPNNKISAPLCVNYCLAVKKQ